MGWHRTGGKGQRGATPRINVVRSANGLRRRLTPHSGVRRSSACCQREPTPPGGITLCGPPRFASSVVVSSSAGRITLRRFPRPLPSSTGTGVGVRFPVSTPSDGGGMMSTKNKEEGYAKVAQAVNQIMEAYPEERTLVHTVSCLGDKQIRFRPLTKGMAMITMAIGAAALPACSPRRKRLVR